MGFEYLADGDHSWVIGDPGAPWHQYHSTWMMGATVSGESTVGGTQKEARLYVEYRDNFTGYDPAWWVGFQGQWIGYLDVDEANFAQMNTSGCSFDIYAEAHDADHETNPWMDADMGSGEFAVQSGFSQDYGDVAYFRKPLYYAAKNGASPTWVGGRWGARIPSVTTRGIRQMARLLGAGTPPSSLEGLAATANIVLQIRTVTLASRTARLAARCHAGPAEEQGVLAGQVEPPPAVQATSIVQVPTAPVIGHHVKFDWRFR